MKFTPPYWVQIKDPKTNKWLQGMINSERELKEIRKELVRNQAWFIISCTNSDEETGILLIETIK